MSKTKTVACYGGPSPKRPDPQREIWVYDAALSLLLAQVIRSVESAPPDDRPNWWADRAEELRLQATVSDISFELAGGSGAGEREEFAELLEDAADRLRDRGIFTAAEAAGWQVIDDETVIFRGDSATDTEPVAELGRALAALLRGPLPAPPAGTIWLYGSPGGRTTLGVVNPADEG
ncbi:hypothetical protein [Krasilnikovia sp. MM14-A1259]|uniref:hypothetical protein n=1 Tax=Krasilnikovia sp. MM14-A1259 TaxID=3373539 RepID=UPI003813C9AC